MPRPAPSARPILRRRAHANDHEIGRQTLPVVRLDRLDACRPDQARDATVREADAVFEMRLRVDLRDIRAEDVLERSLAACQERDRVAELAQRRGDFGTDPSAAYNDDFVSIRGGFAQRVRIGTIAQVAHSLEVRAGNVEPPRRRAGGQDKGIERDLARGRRRRPARRVDGRGSNAATQLDALRRRTRSPGARSAFSIASSPRRYVFDIGGRS